MYYRNILEHHALPWPAPALVVGVHSIVRVLRNVSHDLQFGCAVTSDLKVLTNSFEVVVLFATTVFCNNFVWV